MANQGINTALLSYMQERANQVVTIDQMTNHFKDRLDRRQILSNMANLLQTPVGKQIERLQTGMWRFSDKNDVKPDTESRQIFELLRTLNDGLLLIGEDGELYRAKRIRL